MTTLTVRRCDRPDCERRQVLEEEGTAIEWIEVAPPRRGDHLHFCDWYCLAAFAIKSFAADVPGTG